MIAAHLYDLDGIGRVDELSAVSHVPRIHGPFFPIVSPWESSSPRRFPSLGGNLRV